MPSALSISHIQNIEVTFIKNKILDFFKSFVYNIDTKSKRKEKAI